MTTEVVTDTGRVEVLSQDDPSFDIVPFDMRTATAEERKTVLDFLIRRDGAHTDSASDKMAEYAERSLLSERGLDYLIARDKTTRELIGVAVGKAVLPDDPGDDCVIMAERYSIEYLVVDPNDDEDVDLALAKQQVEWAREWRHSVLIAIGSFATLFEHASLEEREGILTATLRLNGDE